MENIPIIGVDEVGRGCIAGDLLVCAYCFDSTASEDLVDEARALAADSKSFSTRRRREAGLPVLREAGIWVFARRTPVEIDASNIRSATLSAMAEAARVLRDKLATDIPVVFDGRDLPDGVKAPASTCIKGDARIPEIAAASMLAKVARDSEMEELARQFPGYGFEANAGYGTQAHREAIARLGLSSIHRTWAKKFVAT